MQHEVIIGGKRYLLNYDFLELEAIEEESGDGFLSVYGRYYGLKRSSDLYLLLWAGTLKQKAFNTPADVRSSMKINEHVDASFVVIRALDDVFAKDAEDDAGAEKNVSPTTSDIAES